jgi:hypothetical protein
VYLSARGLLSSDQRKDFLTIPSTLSNWELAYYYTLTRDDIEVIMLRREIITDWDSLIKSVFFVILVGLFQISRTFLIR